LSAGLCPDLVRELTALPHTPWLDLRDLLLMEGKGGEWRKQGGERKGGRGGKGFARSM